MSNSLLEQAIRMEQPETLPISISILPSAWFKYKDELQKLTDDYPQFFNGKKVEFEKLRENLRTTYREGKHTDEWGCVWENEVEGMEAIVKEHPLKCEDDIYKLKIPENRDGRTPHGFMYLRLLDVRI